MLVMLAGTTLLLHPRTSLLVAVSMMALQLSRLSNTLLPFSTDILSMFEHPPNALLPMLVKFLETVMLVMPTQPLNALLPMVVRFSGRVMFVRFAQP